MSHVRRPYLIALVACLAFGFPFSAARSEEVSVKVRLARPVASAASPAGPQAQRRSATDWPAWLLLYRLTDSDQSDSHESASMIDGLTDRWATPPEGSPLSLTGSIKDQEARDLRALIVRGERWHVLRFDGAASLRPLDARVTAFGSIPYLPIEPDVPSLDDAYIPALLGVTGTMDDFELGVKYRSVGKRLDRIVSAGWAKKDREGSEVWLARRFGSLRLRLSRSELSDNVDRDPVLARTTKSETVATAELTVPAGPILSVAYGTGEARRVRPASEAAAIRERTTFDSVTGSAYYPGLRWDVTASTTYSLGRESVGSADETAGLYHALSLSLRPSDSLTVTPVLSGGSERDATTGAQWNTGWASLTLTYSPSASRWSAWSTIGYGGNRSSDGLVENAGINVGGGVTWEFAKIGTLRSAISAEAGYDQYQDRVSSANSSLGAFALLRLKVTGF